jgi:hypothetical protein
MFEVWFYGVCINMVLFGLARILGLALGGLWWLVYVYDGLGYYVFMHAWFGVWCMCLRFWPCLGFL